MSRPSLTPTAILDARLLELGWDGDADTRDAFILLALDVGEVERNVRELAKASEAVGKKILRGKRGLAAKDAAGPTAQIVKAAIKAVETEGGRVTVNAVMAKIAPADRPSQSTVKKYIKLAKAPPQQG